MMFKPVFLATDYVLFGLLAALIIYVVHVCRTDELKMRWSHVFHSPTALCTFTILSIFLAFAVLDSIHFRPAIDSSNNHVVYENGKPVRDYEPLTAGGAHLSEGQSKAFDIGKRVFFGLGLGLGLSFLLWIMIAKFVSFKKSIPLKQEFSLLFSHRGSVPYEFILLPLTVFITLASLTAFLWPVYHVLGTDQTGNDILYQVLKSLRTALVIGSLATLTTLPFAIICGICSGYTFTRPYPRFQAFC